MNESLRVLIVEDSEDDALLVVRELRHGGFDVIFHRVDTAEAMNHALDSGEWDVIISDYSMPRFNGEEALWIARNRSSDVPFIFVSGTIGEEVAVAAMREGASDYLLKDRTGRLCQSIHQALERRRLRERQQSTERALRESQQRLRLILDTANDAYVGMDTAGRIIDWNARAESMFGWSAEEAIGQVLSETIVPPRYREPHARGLQHFLETGEGAILNQRQDLTALHRDGHEFAVEVVVWPVYSGQSLTLSAFIRDVSQRKRLEEQLRQAQKMEAIGQLAGGVAHDFNNLLTVIAGYSEILLADQNLGSATRDLILEISKAGARAATLTRQLLAFSRKQVLEPQVLDLNLLILDIERMLKRLIGEDVKLTAALDPGLAHIRADLGQLEQVIVNLVVNARDAMPHGGQLTLETSDVVLEENYTKAHADLKPGKYVMLAVSDSGCGMTQEIRSRIFEPFFTTKGPGKGTGLGLATVYGIVKQSGGHIAVYSEPGLGTTFKVYFPRAEQQPAARRSRISSKSMPTGTETVLLVEDEIGVRAIARHVLQLCGYHVLEAVNGVEAVRLSDQTAGAIDLILTDVVMPELGGRSVFERLRETRPGIKVLYMSGYTDDAVIRHGVLRADTPFLQKPFTPAALAQKVREVLDK